MATKKTAAGKIKVRTSTPAPGFTIVHLSDEPAHAQAILQQALKSQVPPNWDVLEKALIEGGIIPKTFKLDRDNSIQVCHLDYANGKAGDLAVTPPGFEGDAFALANAGAPATVPGQEGTGDQADQEAAFEMMLESLRNMADDDDLEGDEEGDEPVRRFG